MKIRSLCLAALFALAAYSSSSAADTTVIAGWDRQLFPSYLIATASVKPQQATEEEDPCMLGDPDGQIGVRITATEDDQPVKVIVHCDEFMEVSEFSGKLPMAGETYTIHPKIRYRYEKLSKCRQASPATLTVRVELDSEAAEETSTTVVFRSINDCPLQVATADGVVNTEFTFAAYVNEQHPFVDKLLREALDLGVVTRFTGYQSQDETEVLRQVYALWDLMVARDVRYSDITATAADSSEVLSQHVRLIEETANNSQANCVDGSVLFVSMLRKIGINASLVLEPGHCFILFSTDEKGENIYGLETTLVDADVDLPEDSPEFLDDAVDEELRGDRSWPSFVAAVCTATRNLAENVENHKQHKNGYAIIHVYQARKAGVLPIAFDNQEVFVSYDYTDYVRNSYSTEEESEDDTEWSEEEESDSEWDENADEESDEESDE